MLGVPEPSRTKALETNDGPIYGIQGNSKYKTVSSVTL